MILITNMLLTKQDYGTVAAVEAPGAHVAALVQQLEDAGRSDLAMLVAIGDDGVLVVTAGGVAWRFGGL